MDDLGGGFSEPLSVRQVFFTNLLTLGFDPLSMERKHRIPFNKDMFKLPNKKGFEVVMHFLFSRLNPAMAKEEFRDCWPVRDKKEEQQFRKATNNWLLNIAKDDPDARFPRVVASLFMSPGGERFYHLMLAFSRYILFKILVTETGLRSGEILQFPSVTSHSLGIVDCTGQVIKCSTVRLRQRFLRHTQQQISMQNEWKQYASELVKENRGLSKALREVERLKRSELQKVLENGPVIGSPLPKNRLAHADYAFDIQSVERAQRVQKVREMWKSVEDFYTSQTEEREVVDSILHGTLDKYKIDASQFNIKVPDLLLRECEKEIHRRNVENIYQGGKLNLLSAIQLWNLCLHMYVEKLHEGGLQDVGDELDSVTNQVHRHNANLNHAQALRTKLTNEVIPSLKKSIEELKSNLYNDSAKSFPPRHPQTTSLGLGLQPLTPPVRFIDINGHLQGDESTLKEDYSVNTTLTPTKVDTPDAVARILDSVGISAQSRANSLIQGSPVYAPKLSLSGQAAGANILPVSKLPKRMFDKNLDVGTIPNKQRSRVMSAPSYTSHNTNRVTRPPFFPEAIGQDSVQRVDETAAETEITKQTPSGTTLTHIPVEKPIGARKKLTDQKQRPQPMKADHGQASLTNHQVFKAPLSTKKVIKRSKKVTPRVKRHVGVSATAPRPMPATPTAHEILIEKIVDSVTGKRGQEGVDRNSLSPAHSPIELFLRDPTAALNEEAFKSREKLKHSPVGGATVYDKKQDSNNNAEKALDSLATKLFSEEIENEVELQGDMLNISSEETADILYADGSPEHSKPRHQSASHYNSKNTAPEGRTFNDILTLNSLTSTTREEVHPRTEPEGGLSSLELIDLSSLRNGSNPQDKVTGRDDLEDEVLGSHDLNLEDANTTYMDLFQSQTPCLPRRTKRVEQSTFSEERLFEFGEADPEQLRVPDAAVTDSPWQDDLAITGTRLIVVTTPAKKSATCTKEGKLRGSLDVGTGQNNDKFWTKNSSTSSVGSSLAAIPKHSPQISFKQNATGEHVKLTQSSSKSSNSTDTSSVKTQNPLAHPAGITVHRSNSSSGESSATDDLIARYRKLKLTTNAENEVSSSDEASSVISAVLSEKCLFPSPRQQRQNNEETRSKAPQFSFDLCDMSPPFSIAKFSPAKEGIQVTPSALPKISQQQTQMVGPASTMVTPKQTVEDSEDNTGILVEFTPYHTPKKAMLRNQLDAKSPMLKLASMPMSPTTSALHGERPSFHHHTELLDDILDEDDSVLLPVSPENAQPSNLQSPPLGFLIDI